MTEENKIRSEMIKEIQALYNHIGDLHNTVSTMLDTLINEEKEVEYGN